MGIRHTRRRGGLKSRQKSLFSWGEKPGELGSKRTKEIRNATLTRTNQETRFSVAEVTTRPSFADERDHRHWFPSRSGREGANIFHHAQSRGSCDDGYGGDLGWLKSLEGKMPSIRLLRETLGDPPRAFSETSLPQKGSTPLPDSVDVICFRHSLIPTGHLQLRASPR